MPVGGVRALGELLAQSAPQLFDRSTMVQHLETLKRLLQQTEAYELHAGRDLYHEPAKLTRSDTRSARREQLARIVIELTNRCNLSCGHCFEERHAATGDLPLEILEKVLRDGKSCGIEQVSFTGGEPTIHRRFEEIIDLVSQAGYPFSFVSNGASFPRIYPIAAQAPQLVSWRHFQLGWSARRNP